MTDHSTERRAPRRSLTRAAAGAIVAILAALVLAADQFAKYLALTSLPFQQPVRVWGDALQFYLTRNPGAAFSLLDGQTWIFTIVMTVAAVVIVSLTVTRVRSRVWAIVLGLLLGGILGNLGDRLFRDPGFLVGHVVDFINTPWMWLGMNPAIYNIADMFIVTMMIGVALLVLIGVRLDGSRERDARGGAAAEPVTRGEDGTTTAPREA